MDKENICKVLIEKGYEASVESGVVMITSIDINNINAFEKGVLKIFNENGYKASYGFRYRKND